VSRRIFRRIFPLHVPKHPFDARYGVDTSGLIGNKDLVTGHANDEHSVAYYGTAPSLFAGILDHWIGTLAERSLSPADFTLIDIGCGKGRVVMLASETPFQEIIGVELSPQLAWIAQQNLGIWNAAPHPCARLSIVQDDAFDLAIPESPVLIYLFNPFGAVLVQRLVEHLLTLAATRTTLVDLLYVHPVHADLVATIPGVHLQWDGQIPFSPEDTAADAFRDRSERCCIYRIEGGTP